MVWTTVQNEDIFWNDCNRNIWLGVRFSRITATEVLDQEWDFLEWLQQKYLIRSEIFTLDLMNCVSPQNALHGSLGMKNQEPIIVALPSLWLGTLGSWFFIVFLGVLLLFVFLFFFHACCFCLKKSGIHTCTLGTALCQSLTHLACPSSRPTHLWSQTNLPYFLFLICPHAPLHELCCMLSADKSHRDFRTKLKGAV